MNIKQSGRIICRFVLAAIAILISSSWGFYAHKKINTLAVFTLPPGMIKFYKANLQYIGDHATDPDKRRYIDSMEAPRHYLDADHYGNAPFDSIPEKWKDAVLKYSADTLRAYGTAPWQIQITYLNLVKAFEEKRFNKILKLSSDLGHYVGDIHVPLHTTENYNGQLTGQTGIHAFWESRLPELFSENYDFIVGKPGYIESPLKEAWKILRHTNSYKDSVLNIEARLNKSFPGDKKYSFVQRNGILARQYSNEYSAAYHHALKGMVEKQMRGAIHEVASYWYSAWVDAGQPDLNTIPKTETSVDTTTVAQTKQTLIREEN